MSHRLCAAFCVVLVVFVVVVVVVGDVIVSSCQSKHQTTTITMRILVRRHCVSALQFSQLSLVFDVSVVAIAVVCVVLVVILPASLVVPRFAFIAPVLLMIVFACLSGGCQEVQFWSPPDTRVSSFCCATPYLVEIDTSPLDNDVIELNDEGTADFQPSRALPEDVRNRLISIVAKGADGGVRR